MGLHKSLAFERIPVPWTMKKPSLVNSKYGGGGVDIEFNTHNFISNIEAADAS